MKFFLHKTDERAKQIFITTSVIWTYRARSTPKAHGSGMRSIDLDHAKKKMADVLDVDVEDKGGFSEDEGEGNHFAAKYKAKMYCHIHFLL